MSKLHLCLLTNENMDNEEYSIKFKFYNKKYLNLYFPAYKI